MLSQIVFFKVKKVRTAHLFLFRKNGFYLALMGKVGSFILDWYYSALYMMLQPSLGQVSVVS